MRISLNGIVCFHACKPMILAFDGLDDATNDFRESVCVTNDFRERVCVINDFRECVCVCSAAVWGGRAF